MMDQTHIVQLSGLDTATCGDLLVKDAKNAICKLARLMEDAGFDPRDYLEIKRGGTTCIKPARLGWWAAHNVSEGDDSVRFVKFRPFNVQAFA